MLFNQKAVSLIVSTIVLAFMVLGCGSTQNTSSNSASISSSKNVEPVKGYFEFKKAVENSRFTSLDGDTVSVSDFRGKVVMIDFWETWCTPCIRSFPGIDDLKNEYPEKFAVLAVTPGFDDDRYDVKDFARGNDYEFTYLLDSWSLHKKLGVSAIPYKIFLDTQGNFIKTSTGSKGPHDDYRKIKKIVENNS